MPGVRPLSRRLVMKYLGGLLMFVAITVVAESAQWKPDPDRWIIELLIWFVSAGLFLGGVRGPHCVRP
jgi:hypothetical protein